MTRPALSGFTPPQHQAHVIQRLTSSTNELLALYGQIIARLVEAQGGSWRVLECGTCFEGQGFKRYLEVSLPDGPVLITPLGGHDQISHDQVTRLTTTPEIVPTAALIAWIQGVSPPLLDDEPTLPFNG